jgi:hypothetical protein
MTASVQACNNSYLAELQVVASPGGRSAFGGHQATSAVANTRHGRPDQRLKPRRQGEHRELRSNAAVCDCGHRLGPGTVWKVSMPLVTTAGGLCGSQRRVGIAIGSNLIWYLKYAAGKLLRVLLGSGLDCRRTTLGVGSLPEREYPPRVGSGAATVISATIRSWRADDRRARGGGRLRHNFWRQRRNHTACLVAGRATRRHPIFMTADARMTRTR